MELRNPNKGHYPLLAALLGRCFEPGWSEQALADRVYYDPHYDPNHVWMAREAGQVLGLLVSTLDGDQAWLKLLAIAPEARRKGLASDLLSRAEFRLSGEGAKRLLIEGTPPHEFLPGVPLGGEAEAFFRKQGYQSAPVTARWVPAASVATEGAALDKAATIAFARQHSGAAWPWVEETLGFQPPRMAYQAGAGLILAEPGQSLGPVWLDPSAEAAAALKLLEAGRAIASTAPVADPRGLRFWQTPGAAPWPQALPSTPQDFLCFSKTLA